MKLEGFVGPSYTLESVNVDAQRCVNMYPVGLEKGGKGKEGRLSYLAPTDGLLELLTVGTGVLRLVYVDNAGKIFVVSGDEVYIISESAGTWSASLLGLSGTAGGGVANLLTTTGPVKAASSSLGDGISQTIFVDGTSMYSFWEDALGNQLFSQYSLTIYDQVATATSITWIDGFFIVNEAGTGRFHSSDVGVPNFGTLTFATSEADPDILLTVMSKNRNLYLFNERTTEIFANTGNQDFPFERIQGGFIQVGCAAAESVAKIDDIILWLGRSEHGTGIVYAITGFKEQRISTSAIELAIASYVDMTTAKAFAYQKDGNRFYILNFDEATWVYDLDSGLWHERAFTNAGTLERHLAEYHAYDPAHNYHIVSDYASTEIYILDSDTNTDDLSAITRMRTCPHLSAELKRIFYHSLQLDLEAGVGLSGGVQGSTPEIMLDFSDDGGHTWSSESWATIDNVIGAIGEYKTRVIWRRLGASRDRIFRFKMTDPVKCIWMNVELSIDQGAS